MTGYCSEELNPFGPDQAKVTPVLSVFAESWMSSPSQGDVAVASTDTVLPMEVTPILAELTHPNPFMTVIV